MSYQPIEPIPSQPATPSLLDMARKLPDGTVWRTGVSFRDTGSRAASAWPYAPGVTGARADKAAATGGGVANFLPVVLYVPITCDSVTPLVQGELDVEARLELAAQSGMQLARELMRQDRAPQVGAGYAQNPSIIQPYPGHAWGLDADGNAAPNVVTVGAAGHDATSAVADVLGEYTARTMKGGAYLHVPVNLLPHLLRQAVVRQQGNTYVGPMNSLVVPHSETFGPAAANGTPAAATAGNEWIYATGPVEAEVGEIQVLPDDESQRFEAFRRMNRFHVWAERLGIYRFNPSVVIAAQALRPTTAE